MTKKNYQVGLLITGDAKSGVKATQLTRKGLKDLSTQQKKTSKTTKGLREQSGSLIGKLGKVASVTGLATAAVTSMSAVMRTQAITEMKVMADTLDLSTQALSEWSTAGAKFNVGNEKMVDIFKDLQDKIGDFAATGGGEAKDIFKKLNLDINEFSGIGADEQLLKIAGALDDVASHSEKIFYMEALANDASRLLPLLEDGAKGLKAAQVEARLLGTSINDVDAEMIAVAGREFQRTGDVVTGLGNTITAKLAPALGGMNEGIADIVIGFGGWEAIIDNVIDYTLTGLGFVLDNLKPLHVMLLTSSLGWLNIGKAATSAMAASAEITADVINTVLEPFQALLWGIADGWGTILIGIGQFTGDDRITSLGESLKGFAHDVSKFSVSADDIVAADKAMDSAITGTKKALIDAKKATRGADLRKAWDENTQAAKDNAEATVAATEAQRLLDRQAAATQKTLTSDPSEDDFYQKAIDGVNGYSNAWASAGNVIIDTFGSIGQQMEKLITNQDAYTKAIEINHKKQKATGADVKKLKAEEYKLNFANTQSQINSYSSIAGAAGDMFSENSKAAKVAHGIEQALALASLAMSIQKMVMGTTETAAVVANESIKQVALGTTAIITQGQGDPYTAWARIAAMIAVVAGLGIATSGSSGSAPSTSEERQETQGTGSVFGDSSAKSSSISSAYERIESLELNQYAELQKMNSSLRDLNSNMTHLARSLISGFGNFDGSAYGGEVGEKSSNSKLEDLLFGGSALVDSVLGSFSKTKKTVIDSGISMVGQTLGEIIESGVVNAQAYYDIKKKKSKWWGASSKTSYSTEYQDIDDSTQREFALIFGNIGTTITSAIDILGLEIAQETNLFTSALIENFNKFNIDDVGFRDFFTGITTELNEGATRSLDNFVINLPNISFSEMSGDEIEKELQAIFSNQADLMAQYLVPQIAEFQQIGKGLYDTLIRVSQEQVVFNAGMEAIGHSLANVADLTNLAQISISQSLIELMGGIEEFQAATSTYFAEFFSEDEQFAYLEKNLSSLFDGLGESLPKTRAEFKLLLEGIDLTTESGIALYAAIMGIIGSLDEYYDASEDAAEIARDAAAAERELALARKDMLSDLLNELNRFDMSEIEKGFADINTWTEEQISALKELNVTDFSLVNKIADKKKFALAEQHIEASVNKASSELSRLSSVFDSSVSGFENTFTSLVATIKATSTGIQDEILSLRRSNPEFDNIAFLNTQVSGLQGQLSGSTSTQLDVIEKLKSAIVERYNAELSGLSDVEQASLAAIDLQQELYQTQLEHFDSLTAAAKQMRDAAQSLLISDVSPLTNREQFSEASSQFSDLFGKSQAGDLDAYSALQDVGTRYIQLAKDYDPANFQDTFDYVRNAYNELGNVNIEEPTAPLPHSNTDAYQTQSLDLAQQAINELTNLDALVLALEPLAQAELDKELYALREQLANDSSSIISTMESEIAEVRALLPEQTTAILASLSVEVDAIYAMHKGIVSELEKLTNIFEAPIAVLPPELPPVLAPELPPWFGSKDPFDKWRTPPIITIPKVPIEIIKLTEPEWFKTEPALLNFKLTEPQWLKDDPIWFDDNVTFTVPEIKMPALDFSTFELPAAMNFDAIVSELKEVKKTFVVTNNKLDAESLKSTERNKTLLEQKEVQSVQNENIKKLDTNFTQLSERFNDVNNEFLELVDKGLA